MSDNYDDLITDAFSEFGTINATQVRAKGTLAVHNTVAHRRKVRATMLTVLGALLIAAPIAAFAANPKGNSSPPGQSPSPSLEITASPSPSLSPTPTTPDGRLTAAQLTTAKVATAEFERAECPGKVDGSKVKVRQVVHTNLDGDAALETAALIDCTVEEFLAPVVMGYDRDAAGKVVGLGKVITELKAGGVDSIKVRPSGGIIADMVWDPQSPEPGDPHNQIREYAWNGSKFVQVAGQTAFVAYKSELTITGSTLKLGPVKDGVRKGTLRFTVKNSGPQGSNEIDILFAGGITRAGTNNSGMGLAPLKSGASKSVEVEVQASAEWADTSIGIYVECYATENRENNWVRIQVTRS